ncbi:hypothetical protein CfE428DRAFT_0043 [Chthoniobacter flavus Ellin428]|uniref:Uncharacterized protein n=1 Tax=Chthoniobacter flavus Ellin428 TaxID=497964 RepID=B4CVA5_9BACT|nr:hypothetical protein [Chthoniobacter flavus]EDY21918.1 hypothetical protein CfE428DRAFT_0043 [Chthoniobacter flavus Ellin428]TCO89310.1 hypothetical protein EV701_11444 [Chthoniobacter flavus]
MHAIPAVVFLIAALACAFIGRILLINAAFGASTLWGFTVLFVPFGPLFFRMKYRELAYPTRYWRMATLPLFALFIANGGSMNTLHGFKGFSLQSLEDLAKPKTEVASAGDTHFKLPGTDALKTAAAMAVPTPAPTPVTATTPATKTAAPVANATVPATNATAPAATPSKGVAAAMSTMPAAPKVLSLAERLEANRKEFERLAEWYTNLKNERGYLRKGDAAGVIAYNAEAAKYQTALQLAKTEQADLAKLAAKQ